MEMSFKELREVSGLSQRALARASGANQATISKIESGETGNVTIDVVLRLAYALKTAPETVFEMLADIERKNQ